MGKPFCRKNNKGQPRWYIYVTFKGHRVRKVAGKTKTEALRYQRDWENRLEREKGASIRDKKIPFGFLCNEYLKWAGNNLGKQTLRERVMIARAHLKPFFKCLAKEIGRVLAASRPVVRPMLQVLIFTGMRKGEMAHLQWDDIDFDNRIIHIQPKKDWNPKSGKPRSIPINNPALEALLEARNAHLQRGRKSQLVFPGRKGCIGDIRDGLNHACARRASPRGP